MRTALVILAFLLLSIGMLVSCAHDAKAYRQFVAAGVCR